MLIEFLEGFAITLPPDHISIGIIGSTVIEFEAKLMVDGIEVPIVIERQSFCVNIPESEGT